MQGAEEAVGDGTVRILGIMGGTAQGGSCGWMSSTTLKNITYSCKCWEEVYLSGAGPLFVLEAAELDD